MYPLTLKAQATRMSTFDYNSLEQLKKKSTEIKLLNRDSLPFMIGFLQKEFIAASRHSIPQSELIPALGNYLFDLNEYYSEQRYTQTPKDYLEDWSTPEAHILRKYYPSNADEACFDLTPSTVRVIQFIESLETHDFVGAESRMKNMLHMLRSLARDSETNPEVLVQDYKQQIMELERKIEQIEVGDVELVDSYMLRGQFFEIQDTAKNLLYDFRQVGENFRKLDQNIREHFSSDERSKGKILDDVFREHDQIRESDQGKSFRAFWEFLMSPHHQNELKALLGKVLSISELQELENEAFLEGFAENLLDAGESVYSSYNLITEQLRQYLESQIHVENRRIMELIHDIERQALAVKDLDRRKLPGLKFQSRKPNVSFPMSKILFTHPKRPLIDDNPIYAGASELNLAALYPEGSVDEKRLLSNIKGALTDKVSISMPDLFQYYPIVDGLAEVLTYFRFAVYREVPATVVKHSSQIISWKRSEDQVCEIQLPEVFFLRKKG
ncbi:DUF3375 domain-containing protein [Deltaproteobacteria bacterium TL4]